MPREGENDRKKRFSPIATLLGWLISLIFFIVIALITSIVVEWIGMFTIWKDQGVSHSQTMFMNELKFANNHISDSIFSFEARSTLTRALSSVDDKIDAVNTTWSLESYESNIIYNLLTSAMNTSKTFVLRLFIVIFSLPLFLLAFWYAVIDGAVERNLRQFGGDGESNVIFDFTSALSTWIVAFGCMVYLAMPISINPVYCILPTFILFFSFTRTTIASYKKKV